MKGSVASTMGKQAPSKREVLYVSTSSSRLVKLSPIASHNTHSTFSFQRFTVLLITVISVFVFAAFMSYALVKRHITKASFSLFAFFNAEAFAACRQC